MDSFRLLMAAVATTATTVLGVVGMECRDPNLRDAVQVVSATTGSGPAIVSSTLVPDALPGKTSDMVLAGTRIPVQIVTKHDGQEFMIELRAHGQTFEQERYVDGPTAFSFHGTSDETYVPDIDLVRFPMHVGDSWDWSGTVSSGGISRKASAEVKTSPKSLYFGDASAQAIEVEVDLSLFSQGEKLPASRKLKFDFVPGQGILRREFGDASVREPSKP